MNHLYKLLALIIISYFFIGANIDNSIDIEIKQNKNTLTIKKGKIKLKKKPFTFIVKINNITDSSKVKFIATYNKSTYERTQNGATIKDILGDNNFPYSYDIGNKYEYMVIGEDGYNSWFYSNNDYNNISKYTKNGNKSVFEIKIKDLFIKQIRPQFDATTSVYGIESKMLYLYFELIDKDGTINTKQHLALQFK